MEIYEQKHHRINKRVDNVDLMLNEAIVNRYQKEIDNNNKKNVYYQSIIDYQLYMRSQMTEIEYPILSEVGFNQMTDIDAVKSDEFVIPSYNLYYNENYSSKKITFLELKQTRRIKTYNYWKKALKGDVNKRYFEGSAEELAMMNGLLKEIQTLKQIAGESKIIVALTMDKTIIGEGYETEFYQYSQESNKMQFLNKRHRKEDFKLTLKQLTQ